jgi:hypothetical protein
MSGKVQTTGAGGADIIRAYEHMNKYANEARTKCTSWNVFGLHVPKMMFSDKKGLAQVDRTQQMVEDALKQIQAMRKQIAGGDGQ